MTRTGTVARMGPKKGIITNRPLNTASTPEYGTPNAASVRSVAMP